MTDTYRWNFGAAIDSLPYLLGGLVGNAKLWFASIIFGLLLGLFIGIGRYSKRVVLRWPATLFVEVFRNTPVLVQIMWFYFAFPIISPFKIDAFSAATLAIALNTGAFSAEIFRAGIQSIGRGQWDAARAVGMNYRQQLATVILPQAVKRMVPPMTSRGIEVFKATTLASAIAYGEILYRAKTIAFDKFNPIETYTIVALIFFSVVYPVTRVVQRFEFSTKAGKR